MAPLHSAQLRSVLFDLDGTLVDTALDMVAVLQTLQRDHGVEPVSYEYGRSHVSNGAVGLMRIAFPDAADDARETLQAEYLDRYAMRVCEQSRVFAGLDPMLEQLDRSGIPWGVVTNKPARLTEALMAGLGLAARSACIVSGDTLALRKPHPAPLLHACKQIGVQPTDAIYVGDAMRDIQAGLAAGMATVAAAYGYIVDGDDPVSWGAHEIAASTAELAQIVLKAVNLNAK